MSAPRYLLEDYYALKRKKPMKKKMVINDPGVVTVTTNPECIVVHRGMKYAVVRAVYPDNLIRSLTAKTKNAAMAKQPGEVMARPGTTEAAWCLVPLRYIIAPENDLGEIAP